MVAMPEGKDGQEPNLVPAPVPAEPADDGRGYLFLGFSIIGAGLLVVAAIVLHLLAHLSLHDAIAAGTSASDPVGADVVMDGQTPNMLTASAQGMALIGGGGGTARSPDQPGGPVRLSPYHHWMLFADARGGVAAVRPGPRTLSYGWVDPVLANWRRLAWAPLFRPSANRALGIVAQVEALDLPAASRPRLIGRGRACSDCPEMVEVAGGWTFDGARLWQSGWHWNDMRRLARIDDLAIGAKPVASSVWGQCQKDGQCVGQPTSGDDGSLLIKDPALVKPLLVWLSSRTGRKIWIASRAESTLIAPDNAVPSEGEWVCANRDAQADSRSCSIRRGARGADAQAAAAFRIVAGGPVQTAQSRPLVPPTPEPDAAASGPAPRVYLHIAAEAQRLAAQAVAAKIAGLPLNGQKIVVPGIQFRPNSPQISQLRCFTASDCALAPSLLAEIGKATGITFDLSDQSGRYADAKIRPLHYEIWFGSGGA
ncbi:hypothetical protein HZF05_07585 [Sphingomonas sp. CGMCC 1.13654]|uniref:Uncharacterized protein n=1 Tax=Sphingomonas chungangi TaxID=2683589 RepID=A0A838L4Z1_9SPHN|nr:hypothetical protein [Sphingomonas chungangi]MBA2933960.1 hypothetical protein [Sphingomonas chungangi]MVW57086.1 hypothetical protein [Sphingomonas chungangi]